MPQVHWQTRGIGGTGGVPPVNAPMGCRDERTTCSAALPCQVVVQEILLLVVVLVLVVEVHVLLVPVRVLPGLVVGQAV